MKIPLLAGASKGISTNTSSQEAINFFYERPALREGHQGAMLPVHGATLFDTLANAGDLRALLYDSGDSLLYAVSDNDLYSIASNATETARDVLATTSGDVEMAINAPGREILTVDGNTALHYQIDTTTGTDVIDAQFPDTCTTVAMINGRFLVNDPTLSGVFWWSDINDGTSYGATSFATAESLESPVRKIIVDKNDIYLLGDEKAEIWYNSGDPDFVFERFEFIETGIEGALTGVQFDNTVAWLTRSSRGGLQAVKAGSSFQPEVFSTPELTRTWEAYATVSDARAYTYQMDGHEFYVLTFPTANATWAYDALTQEWHQRSAAFSSGSPIREKANCHAYCGAWAGGTHILGDFNSTGKLFALSSTTYTFDSVNMERRLTGPLISSDNEPRIRFSEVQIDIEEGVNESADVNNDRELTLSWSRDGGHLYSSGAQLDLGGRILDFILLESGDKILLESDDGSRLLTEGDNDGSRYLHRLMQRKLGKGRLWNFRIYSDTTRKLIVKGAYGRIAGESLNARLT